MGKLAILIPDTKDFTETETVGSGTCMYIHFKRRRGPFAQKRLTRFLAEKTAGCAVIEERWAKVLELPLLRGDAGRLVHANAVRLLPPNVEHLALFPGRGWQKESILALSQRVRFPELIGGEEAERLAAEVEAETGLAVPVFPVLRPRPEKLVLRLPGAKGGSGLDLSRPEKNCTFLPPPSLRRVCTHTDGSGDTLDALLLFFGFAPSDAGVFLSNFTKQPRTL